MNVLKIVEITPLHVITEDRQAWPLSEHKVSWRMKVDTEHGWHLVKVGKPKSVVFATLFALVALLSFALADEALASPQWPNEPAGSVTLLDCGFSSGQTCGGQLQDPYNSAGGSLTVQSDSTAPFSPTSVLQSKLTYPNRQGGTELHFFAPRDIRNVYVGFWWKPSNPFGGNIVGLNKTFFVRSGYSGSNGVFFWAHRYGDTLATNGNLGQILWNTQVIGTNTDRCGSEGLQCWPNMGSGKRIMPGDGWHKIEARFIGGTCPTCPNGTVMWWIDGVLDGYYPNFQYATTFKEWVWSETWDGFSNGTVPAGYTSDQSHSIDHLHISSTDCDATCQGPGEHTFPPAPPPPSPTPPPPPSGDTVPGKPGQVTGLSVSVF